MKPRNLYIGLLVLAAYGAAYGQDIYRSADPQLRLDVIHSDLEAFYISMDMDPRGNLYVGGRDAVYLFEADGQGGFGERRTITTLPKDTWAYSLQVAGDDLYVLTVTALYRLPNVIRDPGKVSFERLVWGIPLGHIHQGFHGMRMGPDGCLYLAYGDPHPGPFRSRTNPGHVWHWTFLSGPKAKKFPWTGVGAVIRYDPRSHDLEVVSRGFRNICDLDFDEYWNLFGSDNDQEGSSLHSFGRLVHLTEGSHYQWSRGWLEAKEPYRNDLIETIDARLGRFVPFGTCYYNEDHLGSAYKRSLFVARWGSRELGQFPLKPRGSSFVSEQKLLLTGKGTARPVAVFTGNDGRLFVSVCFMQRNEASPVRRTDLVAVSNPGRPWKSTAFDPSKADVARLLKEIESPSWKRRFNAHREIISRGLSGDKQVRERFLDCKAGEAPWFSLAWLAGRSDDKEVAGALAGALSSDNAQVVATAADTLRRFHRLDEAQVKSLLSHQSPVVQLAALRAVEGFDLREPIAVLAQSDDSLVRQAAQRGFGRRATWTMLEEQFRTGELPARRAALAAAMWKWNDTVENGTIPSGVRLSPAAKNHLGGFGYVDDTKSNLQTESRKHGFAVGGLSLKDWWRQLASSDPAAPVIQRMIAHSISDTDDAHRKTAAVFANTLGLDDLAARVPGLAQTRKIKANLAVGAKLSANKAMPPAYQAIDWTKAWKAGDAATGQDLFQQRCVACHDSGQGGGIIGPSLAGVAKRFTPQYLAESVAVPSKDISPNFQAWSVIQARGKVWLGFLSGEDENRVTLQMMDGSLKAIEKSTIRSRKPSATSLMPVGLITGPDELKHIVKFLMRTETGRKPDEFNDLLAGGDLKEHFETTGNWKLSEDGVAHLQPRPGETDWKRYGDYLWLKHSYQDFECEFEYKHDKGGNSGFYFNVTDRQQAVGSVIEVQIRDSAGATKLGAHGIAGGILPGVAPKANAVKPAGEWNRMKVASMGGKITVTLNGKLVNEVTLSHPRLQKKPKQGFIGFQDHGLPFSLRKIRIRGRAASPSPPAAPKPGKKASPPARRASAAKPTGPNVVLIMSDDMGYSDLPKFGKSEIPTPNIDRLAKEGTLFTDAYVTAPICVASRMGLLSGQYQQRFGIYGNIYGKDKTRLFLNQTLLPAVFQNAGYRTAHVGKWHLSGNKRLQYQTAGPRERGFDESIAIRGGDSAFWKGTPVFRNGKQFPAPQYLTDYWGTEACAFIDRAHAQPFFLYLAYNAVHSPMHALDADQDRFSDVADENRRIYDGMLLAMDRSIGRVLERLDRHGIADNTIVVFLNDNGGGESTERYARHSRNFANNLPLRGYKFDLFEGGVRVPMIVRWPGRAPAGKVYGEMVSSTDVYPTLLAAAGLQMPGRQPTDGVDLLPFINGKNKSRPHEWLCWQNRSWLPRKKGGFVTPTPKVHNSAIRKGNWKLVRLNEKIGSDTPPPAWRLYDLAKDIGERNDIANQNEDVVKELSSLFGSWRSTMRPTLE